MRYADIDEDGLMDLYVANGAVFPGLLTDSTTERPSEFWIGVDGVPPDDALRTQLELPADLGVVVTKVVPDSPAAKAGLRQHDVLLSADDKPLAKLADLAEVVKTKHDKLLTLRTTTSFETARNLPGRSRCECRSGKPPTRRPRQCDRRT